MEVRFGERQQFVNTDAHQFGGAWGSFEAREAPATIRQALDLGINFFDAAQTFHASLDALCLAAVLAQPWADVVLSGAATPEQLASHVAAVDMAGPPVMADQLASLREAPQDYWAERSALPWI